MDVPALRHNGRDSPVKKSGQDVLRKSGVQDSAALKRKSFICCSVRIYYIQKIYEKFYT